MMRTHPLFFVLSMLTKYKNKLRGVFILGIRKAWFLIWKKDFLRKISLRKMLIEGGYTVLVPVFVYDYPVNIFSSSSGIRKKNGNSI